MNQQKIYALAQIQYKKKDFKNCMLLIQQAIDEKLLDPINMHNKEVRQYQLILNRYPNSGTYKFLANYFKNDEIFLSCPLVYQLAYLKGIIENDKINQSQQEKLLIELDRQYNLSLFRDRHIIIRKKCVFYAYFDIDYHQFLTDYVEQPRVQLKFYHQAYKLLTEFLSMDEQGLKLYYKFIEDNPSSVEGYDCIEELLENPTERMNLWEQYIKFNPNDRVGYLRLVSIPNSNPATLLHQYIVNNPDDLFGYTQLSLLNNSEKFFDDYLSIHPDHWDAYDKQCQVSYSIKTKFEKNILEDFLERSSQKYSILLSEMQQFKKIIDLNQLILGYEGEKLEFYCNSYCQQQYKKFTDTQVSLKFQIAEQRRVILEGKILYILAIIYLSHQSFNLEEFNSNISKQNNDITLFKSKANFYLSINQLEKAFNVFDDYIQLNPSSYIGYEEKGTLILHFQAKFMKYYVKPNIIKQHWQKYIKIDDDNNLLQQSEILNTIFKQPEQALICLNKFIQNNPQCEEGYLAKIKLLSDYGKSQELLQVIDKYLEVNPLNTEILVKKAQLLVKVYSDEVALQFIDTVNQNDSLQFLIIKSKLIGQKSKEKALVLIDEFLIQQPTNRAGLKFKITYIRDFFGQVFIDNLRTIIKSDPHNWKNYKLFYKLTMEEHDLYDEARDLIDQYIENHPKEKENHSALQSLLIKK